MDRLKAWLGEGLILVPTVLLLGLLLFALSFRLERLSNLAEILPIETDAFFVVNMEDFVASGSPVDEAYLKEFIGVPLNELTWFKRDLGVAWIDGNAVEFLEVKSKQGAEDFFTALVEGEELKNNALNEDIRCFEIESLCFKFEGDFLVFSGSPEALVAVDAPGPGLEDNEHYQNVRGRVGHLESGFVYVNLETAQEFFPQSLFLKSILQIFPAWGASIRMEPQGWYAESFTAVDKNVISGAYFHPDVNYEQKFLPWTKAFAWEWGAQNLAAQVTRMQEIFAKLGSTGEMIFTSTLESNLRDFFGDTDLSEALALLDGESYFGWTSPEDFLFILELENEEDLQKAETLKNKFLQNYSFKQTYVDEKGEEKAEVTALTESPKEYEGHPYLLLKAGEKTIAAFTFTEDAAIVTASEETLLTVLYVKDGRQSGRDLEEISVLLPGSNEIWILDSAFLPEGDILGVRLSTLTRLMSTRKIFDDGVFTRTSLLPSRSETEAKQ
ncbi:MAG: hypothetical protein WC924_05015 [Candidatus Gracilibacteria bacterium]